MSPSIESSRTTFRRINDLVEAGIFDETVGENIGEFLKLANEVTHATRQYSKNDLRRAVELGAHLITQARRRIVGAELEHHFQHNLLWHDAKRPATPGAIQAVVAASASDFDYDYDLYLEIAQKFNLQEKARAAESNFDAEIMQTLTLEKFVKALEFREQEIMRVIKEKRKPRVEQAREDLEWRWPEEWGDIHWNGPVLRDDKPVDFDLERLRRALEKYRRRLNM